MAKKKDRKKQDKKDATTLTMALLKKKVQRGMSKEKKIVIQNNKIRKGAEKRDFQNYLFTGVSGLDELFEKGILKGSTVLIAGGPGSGKTILCLQILAQAAQKGEKCLYLSFEESEERLFIHMDNFGFKGRELAKKGLLKIVRMDPFVLSGSIEALLANAKGELLIGVEEVLEILPRGYKPDRIVIDSISAITAALPSKEEGYRVFIEQFFRYLESLGTSSFLISETEQIPVRFSESGIEEFLADGVIALYNYRRQNVRTTAIEVVKMRGSKIEKRLVPFKIQSGKGIEVYPEATVFGNI